MKSKIGLYVHVPFCGRECFYCHFTKIKYESSSVEVYVDALLKEIFLRANSQYLVDSLYLGGGSPAILPEKQIARIIQAIHKAFVISDKKEFTMEFNPEDVSKKKLKFVTELGVNRLSIGVQSFQIKDLQYLKRNHTKTQSVEAIRIAQDLGVTNINADFIISLPYQSEKILAENFILAQSLNIPHISAYLFEFDESGENRADRDHRLFFFSREILLSLGYEHYELANFCHKGFMSGHNLKYWQNKPYVGVGLSASGYENKCDYRNYDDLPAYLGKIADNELPIKEINKSDLILRKIVVGLRLLGGVPLKFFDRYSDELESLLADRLLFLKNNRVAVNPEKLLLMNEILDYFF